MRLARVFRPRAMPETTRPDRDLERARAALAQRDPVALTISDLRRLGIEAPAQALYTLELQGHQIDRVPVFRSGSEIPGYRLHTIPSAAPEPPAADDSATSGDAGQAPPAQPPPERVTVNLEHGERGWEILTPEHRHLGPCETLDDARRMAYLSVAHTAACELIVHDHDRSAPEHELIAAATRPRRPGDGVEATIRRTAKR